MSQKLTTSDHSRDIAGLKYVYPVISRRAGGLSIGINFNSNNACNWRCVYCQVPDLVRGTAPEMDFQLLVQELRFFLTQVLTGDFYQQYDVPEQYRVIKDIAISGNGEPTSLKGFEQAIELIGKIATEMQVLPKSKFVLITNGSLMHQAQVQAGLKRFNDYNGQVWFKLDSATALGRKKINDSRQTAEKTLENLKIATDLCETSLQTCMLDFLATDEAEQERQAYIEMLQKNTFKIKDIMLYTLARPSLQPEAKQLKKTDARVMQLFADRLRKQGYSVSVTA
jgi:wyosine [tRNA(Phe)-imidazoG37] synthetase (radical SAM superfamily)